MSSVNASIMNGLTEMLVRDIDVKVLHGISYVLVSKKPSNKNVAEKYDALRREMNEAGIGPKDILRRYEVGNGIIYDMDLFEAVRLTEIISNSVSENNNGATPVGDLGIRETAMERHRKDMERLVELIVDSARKGIGDIEVALFSRNMGPDIVVTGVDADNNKRNVAVRYSAFALRHTDIEELNREYLALYNLMVTKVEAHEMLPSATGVRFVLTLARLR